MQPDNSIRELAKKTAKSIVDHGSIPMATLKESIILQEKVDELLAKEIEFPEQEPFPEIPEVDLTPVIDKLDEILTESKKKDLLEYDLQINEDTRNKLKGDRGDTGPSGKDGIDGLDGKDGVDGLNGKDGSPDTPEEIVTKLESLKDESRLDVKAIKGIDKVLQSFRETIVQSRGVKALANLFDVSISGPTNGQVITYDSTTQSWRNTTPGSGAGIDSFETVAENLSAYNFSISYNVNNDPSAIVYSNGVTKTINYTDDNVSSIVLSGSTPGGIALTKSFTYTGQDITGVTYS